MKRQTQVQFYYLCVFDNIESAANVYCKPSDCIDGNGKKKLTEHVISFGMLL